MTFNAMASIVDALKVWPEPVSLPESLEDANRMQLAEARSRLQQIAQVAGELRRLVDRSLAAQLAGGALRYGEDIYRPNGRGIPKVVDPDSWWALIADAVSQVTNEHGRSLLKRLYPANAVRLTALPDLAELMGYSNEGLRSTFIEFDPPTQPLSVMPISKSPKWAQKLEEGQFSGEKNNE